MLKNNLHNHKINPKTVLKCYFQNLKVTLYF